MIEMRTVRMAPNDQFQNIDDQSCDVYTKFKKQISPVAFLEIRKTELELIFFLKEEIQDSGSAGMLEVYYKDERTYLGTERILY